MAQPCGANPRCHKKLHTLVLRSLLKHCLGLSFGAPAGAGVNSARNLTLAESLEKERFFVVRRGGLLEMTAWESISTNC